MRPTTVHILAFDDWFHLALQNSIMRYLSASERVTYRLRMFAPTDVGQVERGDVVIPCFSTLSEAGLPIVRLLHWMGYDCGAIIRTEGDRLWNALAEVHDTAPVHFVVGVAAPEERVKLFPRIPTRMISGELVDEAEGAARFISDAVEALIANRSKSMERLSIYGGT